MEKLKELKAQMEKDLDRAYEAKKENIQSYTNDSWNSYVKARDIYTKSNESYFTELVRLEMLTIDKNLDNLEEDMDNAYEAMKKASVLGDDPKNWSKYLGALKDFIAAVDAYNYERKKDD